MEMKNFYVSILKMTSVYFMAIQLLENARSWRELERDSSDGKSIAG